MMLRAALLAVLGLLGPLALPCPAADGAKPNVVVLLADDSGWGDYSRNGNTNLRTPNIDSLGRDGAALDRFYVCSVCAPTRAEFFTGRYHPRVGVRGVSTGLERLNTDEKTLADTFKAAGYATGAFGKWHNGSQWPYHPNARGFDEYYGFTSGHWGEYFDPPLESNGRPVRGNGFIADDLTSHALDFIERHKTGPFLCYVPFNTPHSPWAVPAEFWERFKNKPLDLRAREGNQEDLDETRCALAMMENLDANVGRVLRRLDELGLKDNTIVLYFSDNGPNTWRWNGGMKGRKGATDEGSLRSVCLMRWPAKIKPGSVIREIAGAIDLLPTLASLAGVPRAGVKPLDGRDLSPLLLGRGGPWPDRLLFSHYGGSASARSQQYRLDTQGALFDMAADPGQRTNVAAHNPEMAARMARALEAWKQEVLPPERDDRPYPVGYLEFPWTPLPARDGVPHGGVRRSAGAPNCSYFVHWTALEDRMSWDVDVQTAGDYDVEILYTCPLADAGSAIELEFKGAKLAGKATPGWDPPLYTNQDTIPRPRAESKMKEFRPLHLGSMRLEKGRGPLTLHALDIPGKSVMDVRQINLTLRAAAAAPAQGPASRITQSIPAPRRLAPFAQGAFAATTNEVFVFVGPENMVIEQRTGWIETVLASGLRESRPRFRHMGWEGDTVYRQNRMQNWGSWKENLDAVDATTAVVWFGQMEALDPSKTPADFDAAYGKLLDALAERTPRIVVLAPPPFEAPADPRVPDNTSLNPVVQKHAEAARRLAAARGLVYVDLFTPLAGREPGAPRLTRDGIHLTEQGMREAAAAVASQLSLGAPSPGDESVRAAIVEKNRLWFNTWRPMNWAFAYGDRTTQPFAKPGDGKPSFVEELTRYRPLIARADDTVRALLEGRPAPAPPPPEAPRADPPALSPAEEKARFEVREGFDVDLFADETLGVVRPLQMRWDERGRLWVVCAPSYPQLQPGERANDYILVLEDTDGDGRADTSAKVAEGLTMPMGMEFGDGGLYVCESSALVHLSDADGNGTFEERRVVLSGFGTGDTHQNINSIRWGADGALWFTQGYHIWSYVETPRGVVELNRSGLWRFNPRTLRLDSFLNESTAGLNAWGVAFDDFGQVFHASGADFVVWHTTPALVPTLHPLNLGPGMAGSRGKSMEPEFLGSSHLPEDWGGLLLKSVYFTSQVRVYRLRDEGSGFASEDLGDLIASKGTEFRPVETRVGPDGALYVCDWLNPVIGHYQASYRDPRRDRSHGRIWRMTARGRPLLKRPPLESMDAGQLMDQLNSPQRWVRDQAKFALYRKPKAEVIPRADALLLSKRPGAAQAEERLLYELSGVYAAHEEARPGLIDRLFASEDFRRRAWAAHLAGVWAEKLPDPLVPLRRAVADPHPRVRLEAVVACAWVTNAQAVEVATLAMEKPMDAGIHYALTQCIHALAPRWHPALAAGRLDFGQRFHALAKVLTTVGDTNVVGRVRELLASGRSTGAVRDSLLAVLIENGGPADAEFAITQAPDSTAVLDALVTVAFRKQDIGYHAVLEQLLTSPHSAGRIAGCRVAAAWGQHFGQLPRILKIAGDEKASSQERAAAIAALAKVQGQDALKHVLPLVDSADTRVRDAALAALAPLAPQRIALRCAALLEGARSAAEAGPLLQPLLTLKDGPAILAQAVRDSRVPAQPAKFALQWLGQAGRDDRALVDALRAAAGIAGTRLEYSPKLVASLVAEAMERGDAQRGGQVIRQPEMACLGCHRIGQDGAAAGDLPLGPDLSAASRAMTPEMLVESVFWPKRQVKEGFLLTQVTTKDGRDAQGYKISENSAELRLRLFDGGELVLLKSNLASRNDAGTLMPEGLADTLTPQQRGDVLKFLFGLGKDQ